MDSQKESKIVPKQLGTKKNNTSTGKDKIKYRKKRIGLPDLQSNVQNLLNMLNQNDINGFSKCKKISRKSSKRLSNRQSKYIGVSRNGNYWQVLKNHDQKKKYIGGFTEELEAAISYDFYSMIIDLNQARTNFEYSEELVREMVATFMSDDQVFKPADYVSRLSLAK